MRKLKLSRETLGSLTPQDAGEVGAGLGLGDTAGIACAISKYLCSKGTTCTAKPSNQSNCETCYLPCTFMSYKCR